MNLDKLSQHANVSAQLRFEKQKDWRPYILRVLLLESAEQRSEPPKSIGISAAHLHKPSTEHNLRPHLSLPDPKETVASRLVVFTRYLKRDVDLLNFPKSSLCRFALTHVPEMPVLTSQKGETSSG